jgi:hypothetical protein
VSVPLPTASKNQNGETEPSEDPSVDQAKHEAAEIIAQARRQAEAIIAESRSNGGDPSPLAALGDNAEEIVGQVRKLIKSSASSKMSARKWRKRSGRCRPSGMT